MRTYVYRPTPGTSFRGLVLYSEIFQRTAPIHRMAMILAGHGFLVVVPEIFHELEPLGAVLPSNVVDRPRRRRCHTHSR